MLSKAKLKEIDSIKSVNGRILAAAVEYARAGFYVLPVEPGGKGLPQRTGITYGSANRNVDTVERWFGPGGKFEGFNIGLACGHYDGIFVVDLDNGIDRDGRQKKGTRQYLDMFNEISPEGDARAGAMIQSTPSGGEHLVYRWAPNGASSTSKIAQDVDTRGGDYEASAGHIVVWPSRVAEGEYRWDRITPTLEPAPPWVLERLGKPWKQKHETDKAKLGRGNENLEERDERQYTYSQLEHILGYIDPDELSYDQWLYVGQALNTQHPQDGLELWDHWSQGGARYQQGECHIRWPKFDPEGPIRIGTLIGLAKEGGYDPRTQGRQVTNKNDYELMIDQLNDRFAVAAVGGSVKILMEKRKSDVNPLDDRFELLDRRGFLTLLENDVILIPDKKGNPVPKSKAEIWLADPNRRTYSSGIVFAPNRPKEVDGYYNIWEPWPYEPDDAGMWDLFKEHIFENVCGGNKLHYEWTLDWMADVIQDPMNPKGTCIVLHGQEGNGKGTFARVFGKLFGQHFKHVTDEEHLTGRFNGHLQDGILVFADEVTYGGSKKTSGKLKAMITEPVLMTERKGVDAVRSKNCTHTIIASNELWFIPAGPQSRRWTVFDVTNNKVGDYTFFDRLHAQMEMGGYKRMMYDLAKRKITHNLKIAPVTKALKTQRTILASQDSVYEWLNQAIVSDDLQCEPLDSNWDPNRDGASWPEGKVPVTDLYASYCNWCEQVKATRRTGLTIFSHKMEQLGLKKLRSRTGQGEKRITTLVIPGRTELAVALEARAGMENFEEADNDDNS